MRTYHELFLAATLTMAACTVEDADLAESPAVIEFSMTPSADQTNTFTVEVSGEVTFGYLSPEPATLDILVEGASVYQQTFDVSQSDSASFTAAVPLSQLGQNDVVGVVRYYGQELTAVAEVEVAFAAPAITVPAWQQTYVESESLTLSGELEIAPADGYTIDDVAFKVDDAEWLAATAVSDGVYQVEIVNPDIWDSDVDLRVVTSTDGHVQETHAFTTITVDPIFDCADHAAMLPENGMVRQVGTENRVMLGYFGHPGHAVAFEIAATGVENIGDLAVTSSMLTNGRFAVTEQFLVDDFRCGGDTTCQLDYGLTALVDGVEICSEVDFGQITDFN